MKVMSLAALGFASILSVAGCSSSRGASSATDSEDSISEDGTLPPDATASDVSVVVASKECDDFIAAQGQALSGERAELGQLPTEYKTLAGTYDKLAAKAPADLKADFVIVSKTYSGLSDLAAKANGDITKFTSDPAANELITNANFTASIRRVTIYTNATCPKPKS